MAILRDQKNVEINTSRIALVAAFFLVIGGAAVSAAPVVLALAAMVQSEVPSSRQVYCQQLDLDLPYHVRGFREL